MNSDFKNRHNYMHHLKEFVKSKSKQFRLSIQLHTYPMSQELGGRLLTKIKDSLETLPPDYDKAGIEASLGCLIARYDPDRGDVDNSINEFCLYEGKVRRKLTDSLMLFYLENEGGAVILTFLEMEEPLYFITAKSETAAIDFLKLHLPAELF